MVKFNYWSGTEYVTNEYVPSNTVSAWRFNYTIGYQDGSVKASTYYAMAVRDGDVAASVIPIPAAVWLFASGLGLLGWMRCRAA